MMNENKYEPDSRIVEYLRSKGPFKIVDVVSNSENKRCVICSFLDKNVVFFRSTNPAFSVALVQTCAQDSCVTLLVNEPEWRKIKFATLVVLGSGLADFSKVGLVDPTKYKVESALVKSATYWADQGHKKMPTIIKNICDFQKEKGWLSEAQKRILTNFVEEAKKKAFSSRS